MDWVKPGAQVGTRAAPPPEGRQSRLAGHHGALSDDLTTETLNAVTPKG